MVPAEPMTTVGLKVLLSKLTSKPDGGVTVIPAVIFVPDTLKLSELDAVPNVLLTEDKLPEAVIAGLGAAVTIMFPYA